MHSLNNLASYFLHLLLLFQNRTLPLDIDSMTVKLNLSLFSLFFCFKQSQHLRLIYFHFRVRLNAETIATSWIAFYRKAAFCLKFESNDLTLPLEKNIYK